MVSDTQGKISCLSMGRKFRFCTYWCFITGYGSMELVQCNFKFIELGTCIMYTGAILEPVTWPRVNIQMEKKHHFFF